MNKHTHDRIVCAACRIGVPLAKTWTRTWVLGAAGLGAGAVTRNAGLAVLAGVIGLAVGAMIDAAAEPICGSCAQPGVFA